MNYKKFLILFLFVGLLFAQNTDLDDRQKSADYYLYKLFEKTLNNLRVNLQTSDYIEKDGVSNGLIITDFAHHEIHEGAHYFLQSFDLLSTNGDSLIYCIDVPDTAKRAHLIVNFGSQATMEYYTYVDAECSGGDTISVTNNDLNSSNTSMLTFMKTPTITSIGTLVEKHSTGSGTNAGTGRVGVGGREAEIILKAGSKHIFLFITKANSNTIDYEFSWYEHTPSN